MKRIQRVLLVLVLPVCLSCGGANGAPKPPAPAAKHAAKPHPKVKRALSPEQLQHTMKGRVTAMAACYELSPSKEKQRAGELTVDFTVEPNGKVSGESLASDSIDDKILADCVLGVVRQTAFERSEAAIDVSWPMHFGAR